MIRDADAGRIGAAARLTLRFLREVESLSHAYIGAEEMIRMATETDLYEIRPEWAAASSSEGAMWLILHDLPSEFPGQ